MKCAPLLLAATLLSPALAIGQPAAPPVAPTPRPVEQLGPLYDAYMKGQVEAHNFSGAVLVAKAGAVAFRGAYGAADAATGAQVTPATRFRIGSVTKPFTAVAVMLLAERGKLAVTDPVCKFVEPCPAAWAPVTVHHLLSHTSGIRSFTALDDYEKTMASATSPAETAARVKDLPLEFAPGTQYKYSNTGYVLLGTVIEKASGQSYPAFLKANVLDPLGMKDTGVETGDAVPGLAVGYTRAQAADPASLKPAQPIHMSVPFAAGAMYSTVGDLLKLDRAVASRALLKKDSWEKLLTPVQGNYGYGWMVSRQPNGRTFVGHDGGINGFSSSFRRLEEEDLVFIALRNQDAGPNFSNDLVAIALGAPYQVPKKRALAKVDPALFDDYVGEYQLAPTFSITVTRDGARLLTQATGQQQIEVFPESETTFFLTVVDAQLTFQRDADGKVTGLVLRQAGREMPAKKVK
jgi:CubicO group peptidase (beta-lactamase class C family)